MPDLSRSYKGNPQWVGLTAEQKAAKVFAAVKPEHRTALAIAVELRVSLPTVTKFLHQLVDDGRVVASPDLNFKRIGSAARTFRTPGPDDDIVCGPCSSAGGAHMPVHHAPPACPE
jgi:hypothetical protein